MTRKRTKKSRNRTQNRIKQQKRRKNHTIKKTVKCAPSTDKEKSKLLDFTCYTEEDLERLRQLWNARHPDSKICVKKAKDIWDRLHSKLKPLCNKESCWLQQNFVESKLKTKIMKSRFRPKAPDTWKKNPSEWLSSVDIMEVMAQYERSYKCFEFIGPSPIDYDTHYLDGNCVWSELCEFDLNEKIASKKNKIGIIFNLDEHNKPGSHWVGMFVHIKDKRIIYFDSNGIDPPQEVNRLIRKIYNQGKKIGIDFEVITNKIRHQYEDSECGMYSMYFIIQLLKGKKFEDLTKKRITDTQMNKLRKEFYNSEL
jgi:hypothetical protein